MAETARMVVKSCLGAVRNRSEVAEGRGVPPGPRPRCGDAPEEVAALGQGCGVAQGCDPSGIQESQAGSSPAGGEPG